MLQFDSTYLLYHWISSSYNNGFKNNKCISKVWGCFVHVWHACNSIFQWHCGIWVCIPEYWIKLRWNISREKIRDFPRSHHGCLCQWLDSSWDPQSPKVTYQGARYQKPEQPCYQKVPRLSTKNAVTHNLLLTQPWIQKNSWAGASDCGNWYFVDTVWSQPLYSVPKKKAIVYKMAQRAHKRKPDEYWQHTFGNMKPKWIVQDFWHGSGQDYHSDCIMLMVKQGSSGVLLRDAWIQRLYVQLHL